MKDYIEERAIGIAGYIIDHNATVQTDSEGVRHFEKHSTCGGNNIERTRDKVVWVVE